MRKSEIIATCLVNSGMIKRLEDAQFVVRRIFDDEFPGKIFTQWDTHINDDVANNIISNVGKASHINVKLFIEDLWQ